MLAEPTRVPEVSDSADASESCQAEDLGVELEGLSSSLRSELDDVLQRHHRNVAELVAQSRPLADRVDTKWISERSMQGMGRIVLVDVNKVAVRSPCISTNGQAGDHQLANLFGGSPTSTPRAKPSEWALPDEFERFSEEERKKEIASRLQTTRKTMRASNRSSSSDMSILTGPTYSDDRVSNNNRKQVQSGWTFKLITPLVSSRKFEIFFCILILTNTIFFGIEAEVNARNRTEDSTSGFKAISIFYTCVFFIELILRALASGTRFFRPPDHYWNTFDLVIVILSLLEVVLFVVETVQNHTLENAQNLTYIRMIRIVRTARVLRVVRIFSFFRSLRLLLFSVLNTLRSLLWTMVLLLIILYTFGVIFTQAATQTLAVTGRDSVEGLYKYYGSVGRSVYTLFKSITNGVDWEHVVAPLSSTNYLFVGFFIIYIAFTYFAVLNVVTGVFCQTAIESAAKDQEDIMQVQRASKNDYVRQLTELFCDKDQDGSGELTIDEFEELLQDERLQKYCASLDITIDDAWALFKLLDTDGSGAIEVNEFVTGCLRLRGSARSVDIALLMYQVQWMIERFTKFISYTDGQFECIRGGIIPPPPTRSRTREPTEQVLTPQGSMSSTEKILRLSEQPEIPSTTSSTWEPDLWSSRPRTLI